MSSEGELTQVILVWADILFSGKVKPGKGMQVLGFSLKILY